MLRFKQTKSLQKFASVHANVHDHFTFERHRFDGQTYKSCRAPNLAERRSLMT